MCLLHFWQQSGLSEGTGRSYRCSGIPPGEAGSFLAPHPDLGKEPWGAEPNTRGSSSCPGAAAGTARSEPGAPDRGHSARSHGAALRTGTCAWPHSRNRCSPLLAHTFPSSGHGCMPGGGEQRRTAPGGQRSWSVSDKQGKLIPACWITGNTNLPFAAGGRRRRLDVRAPGSTGRGLSVRAVAEPGWGKAEALCDGEPEPVGARKRLAAALPCADKEGRRELLHQDVPMAPPEATVGEA